MNVGVLGHADEIIDVLVIRFFSPAVVIPKISMTFNTVSHRVCIQT
jgi:hypothetical protein